MEHKIKAALIAMLKENGNFYLDPMGKDESYERWRVKFYYHRSYADTLFFGSVHAYNMFLEEYNNGYNNYFEFVHDHDYRMGKYFHPNEETLRELKPWLVEVLILDYCED